jgi:hypothetical protein
MTNFLRSLTEVLPAYQQVAINSLITRKKKSGDLQSIRSQQAEIQRLYAEIKGKLGNILLVPKYAVPGTKISSKDHNSNFESIHLDLSALYSNIDKIGKSFLVQSVSLDSGYHKARAAIQKLINDARIFSIRKKYIDFNEIKIIDFNSNRNQSEILPRAELNPKTRLLELRPVFSSRAHLLNRDARYTKIYTKTISHGLKASLANSFPPDNMSDQRPETFWATLVMADSPVQQKYTLKSTGGEQSQIQVSGPVTEIYFKFSHLERVNHVRILPFANFPVKIIDVAYKQTSDGQMFVTIQDFVASSTLDWEEYNFSSIYTTELKVTVAQENSTLNVYQVPEAIIKNTDIFQRIYDAKLSQIIGNSITDSDQLVEANRAGTMYQSVVASLEELVKNAPSDLRSKPRIDYYYNFNSVIADLLAPISPEITKETLFAGYSKQELESDELVQVKKYEYTLGIREIEIGYAVYSPVGNFSTEKFDLQATISDFQLEVDERHTEFETSWETNFRKTSTEWSVDIGGGRVIPVHPRNLTDKDSNLPLAKDELIYFDASIGSATTRLGSRHASVVALKKDGQLIPENQYTVVRQTGSVPVLRIAMTGSAWYDPNSAYTVDYFVDPASYNITVLGKYQSNNLASPELFTTTGPNNDITLSKYPYIDYAVVNLSSFFGSSNAGWSFRAPLPDLFSGQLLTIPMVVDRLGQTLQTGVAGFVITSGSWGARSGQLAQIVSGTPQVNTNYLGTLSGIDFSYYLQVMDSTTLHEINLFPSDYSGVLYSPVTIDTEQLNRWTAQSSGFAFVGDLTGTPQSGTIKVDYKIGIGIKTEDSIYALNRNFYTPLTVTVDGRPATNITNYATLVHPAFSVSSSQGIDYEYIQAGKYIYFNQPIRQDIKVDYDWVTDYIKLQGVLRSHSPVSPELTPKVNEVRLLINTSVI